jgi:hypothetical protein
VIAIGSIAPQDPISALLEGENLQGRGRENNVSVCNNDGGWRFNYNERGRPETKPREAEEAWYGAIAIGPITMNMLVIDYRSTYEHVWNIKKGLL